MTSTARTARHIRRQKLLISCASVALVVTALAHQKARAQVVGNGSGAFQGNPNLVSGDAGIFRGDTTDTITVRTPTATINWSPYDNEGSGPIDFLPAENVATFTSTEGLTDYTVLNRIVPSDPSRSILLNGTVLSTLQGTSQTGGNIWFYSPGGIVVGATAVFDVGGLLLTSIDLPNGFTADSNGFSASFSQTEETAPGAIQILKGAQINARDTYVALIAPRIEQGGTVRVDGSAAYVAGDQVTMTFNQGLFDIAVDVGTDDPNGIVHTGTTGGSSNVAAADNHTIYMAAVPKNQAMTMLLGGNIGYDDAVTAGVENGQIVLSAGWSPFSDETSTGFQTFDTTSDAGFDITGGAFTSSVNALANGNINLSAVNGPLTFEGDIQMQSLLGGITLTASDENTLRVDGATFLSSLGGANGFVTLQADGGGRINLVGFTRLDVSAPEPDSPGEGDSTDSAAGTITLNASGGSIETAELKLLANAVGEDNAGGGDAIGGDAQGGNINLTADDEGSIHITGNLTANANGTGGNMLNGGTTGGAGTGGSINVNADDGDFAVDGTTTMAAQGVGGSWLGEGIPAVAQGGLGQGGFIRFFTSDRGTIDLTGAINLDSSGIGGDGQTGGNAFGGDAGFQAEDGEITLAPTIGIIATGTGGNASAGFGGDGGIGQGGDAYIEALAVVGDIETPATAGTISGGAATLDVSGFGGSGGAGNGDNILAGNGGAGQGGFHNGQLGSGGAFAAAQEPGASLTLGDTTLISNGSGGVGGVGGTGQAGGRGGAGFGGTVQAGNYDTFETSGTTATATYGNLDLFADGRGADGGVGGPGGVGVPGGADGDGGSGTGGSAFISAKGIVHAAEISLSATGSGGSGTNGGSGQGGIGILQSVDGSQLNVDGDVSMDVSAFGGSGFGGLGGEADGGNRGEGGAAGGISALGDGSITIGGTATILADASGGNGLTGGEGFGGAAYLEAIEDSSITAGAIVLSAQASGGGGIDVGGDAFGGTAQLFIDGGSVEATGSTDVFQNDNLAASGSILLFSGATGGTGIQGGEGSGGLSEILMTENGGSLTAANATFLFARGVGGDGDDNTDGDGGAGGEGDGGSVSITTNPLVADASALVSLADTTLNSSGTGGAGGASASSGNGGAGGEADGGRADIDIAAGTKLTAGDIGVLARGFGGAGGSSVDGTGGAGGLADGGSTSLDVAGELDGDSYVALSKSFGGFGGTGATAGIGGDANGGENRATVFQGGTANITTDFILSASPIGGDGSDGGSASEGTSDIHIDGTLTAGRLVEAAAQAFGGIGLSGAGGNANAGTASIDVTGSLTAGQLFVAAGAGGLNAQTNQIYGSGQTNGGSADAGSASLTASGGTIDIGAEGALVTTEAVGGNGVAGVGGFARSGDSTVESTGGGSISGGTAGGKLTVNANATGGDGATVGNASAGDVDLYVDASESGLPTGIDMATIELTARGVLGAGATGSEPFGSGGNIDVHAYDGSITAGALSADAFGSLEGGTIQLESESGSPGAQPGRLQFDTLDAFADSDGTGGNVTVGAGSGTTSDIGEAQLGASGELDGGGSVQIFAGDPETGAGTLLADNLTLTGDEIGLSTFSGGSVDVAGTLQADATDIVTFFDDGNAGFVSADILNVNAFGITFDGTSLGTNIDGTTSVDFETGGDLDVGDGFVTGSLTLHSDAALTTGDLSSGGDMAMSAASIGAGTLDSGGNMALDSGGALTTLDLTALGEIDVDSTGDMQFGNVDADTLDLSSGGTVIGGNIIADTRAGGDADGAITLGDINVGPNVPDNGDFSVSFGSGTSISVGNVSGADKVGFATRGSLTTGDISAGSLFLAMVNGDISVGSITTAPDGQVYLADSSMFTDAGGPDDFDVSLVLAASPVATHGSITIDGIVSTGTFQAAAGTDFGSGKIDATGSVSATAGEKLTVADIDAGGDLTLTASTNFEGGNLSSGGDMNLDAGGDLTTLDLTSEQAVSASAGGDLKVGKIISGFVPGISDDAFEPTDQDVTLSSDGDLTTDAIQSAGNIFLDAGGDVVATDLTATQGVQVTADGDSSVNDVNASGATFDDGGTANFFGTVAAPTIGVTSSDINIAEGASLGVSGLTTLITLDAVSDNPVILGGPEGASAPGQYTLSEAGDINADSVLLTAVGQSEGAADPDVIIQDAQIEGSQSDGGGVGSIEVDTGGSIFVEGFLDYIDAAASDTLTLNAGTGIQVITGGGGISITDSAGDLSGTLNLIAPDIWVADQSVIDQLAEDPNYANRDSDLATNPGEDNQDGNIRAGSILGEESGSFLVQNSGTDDNPAGISVGEGGLTIVNGGESPVLAIVNGHQVSPGGQIVGGDDFLPTVEFGGEAGFVEASTVNGCSIILGCALPPPPPPPPAPTFQFGAESILGPIGLMTNAEDEGDQGGTGDSGDGSEGGNNGNDELDILLFGLNSGQNAFDPLVDDPVTSGSDAIISGGPQ